MCPAYFMKMLQASLADIFCMLSPHFFGDAQTAFRAFDASGSLRNTATFALEVFASGMSLGKEAPALLAHAA